jgi:hypothetical protein
MDQQDWCLDLVGVHERRHLQVDFGLFPESPPLALEAEGRQRAVYALRFRRYQP